MSFLLYCPMVWEHGGVKFLYNDFLPGVEDLKGTHKNSIDFFSYQTSAYSLEQAAWGRSSVVHIFRKTFFFNDGSVGVTQSLKFRREKKRNYTNWYIHRYARVILFFLQIFLIIFIRTKINDKTLFFYSKKYLLHLTWVIS